MSNTHVERWFCCLNPAEQLAVRQCAANAGPITYFVIAELIHASFLLAVEGSSAIRREIFVDNWGLTYGTIPPGDPDGIGVYYLSPSIWDEIKAWLDAGGAFCDDGCRIRTFPN